MALRVTTYLLETKKESFALFLSFYWFDVADTKEFLDIDDAPNGNAQSCSNSKTTIGWSSNYFANAERNWGFRKLGDVADKSQRKTIAKNSKPEAEVQKILSLGMEHGKM